MYIVGNHNKYSFKGTVIEANNSSLLVLVNQEEDEIRSSDKISVSLNNISIKNNIVFEVGDMVEVFYDGTMLDSYPARIINVHKVVKINE